MGSPHRAFLETGPGSARGRRFRRKPFEETCAGSTEHRVNRTPSGIVSTCARLAVAALLASVGAAGCRTASSEAADTVVTGSGHELPVRVVIRGEQARNARRFLDGAVACVRTLGAFEMVRGAVTAIDRPAAGQARAEGGEIVIDRTPWWSSAPAMAP